MARKPGKEAVALKSAGQVCAELLPLAEATLRDALNGVDVLDSAVVAATFVLELAARCQAVH